MGLDDISHLGVISWVPEGSNIARDLGLALGLDPTVEGYCEARFQVQEVIIARGVDEQDDTIAAGLVTNTCWLVE